MDPKSVSGSILKNIQPVSVAQGYLDVLLWGMNPSHPDESGLIKYMTESLSGHLLQCSASFIPSPCSVFSSTAEAAQCHSFHLSPFVAVTLYRALCPSVIWKGISKTYCGLCPPLSYFLSPSPLGALWCLPIYSISLLSVSLVIRLSLTSQAHWRWLWHSPWQD